MASQHVPKVLPQAMASQEALGMAGSREVTSLGNLLFLFGETQRRHSLEERPKKQRTGAARLPLFQSSPLPKFRKLHSPRKRIDEGLILKALGEKVS
jgi:hypothetical protein